MLAMSLPPVLVNGIFSFLSIKKAEKATLSEIDFKANNIDEKVTNTMNSDTA